MALQIDGVKSVHAVRTRWLGGGVMADLHIEVAPNITVREGHDIAAMAKHKLLDNMRKLQDVVIHIEPYEEK